MNTPSDSGSGGGKAPGAMLVAAALIMSAGAALGTYAPSLRDAPWSDDPQQLANAIAGNPGAWVWANGLFMAAAILTALGLAWLTLRFKEASQPWAVMGLMTFAFASVATVINRVISMTIYAWGAQQHLDINDVTVQAFIRFDGGLSAVFFFLGFLSLALFGLAMLRSEPGRRIGWLFVGGAALGIALSLVGMAIPAFVYFGTAALGVASWLKR